MRLYSGPLSMFGAKARIALLEKGIACEIVNVPFDWDRGYDPKHAEVARINPKRQVPVLVDGDLELFDSSLIFEYFEDIKPEPALWPREAKARARARLTELKSDEVFFPIIMKLMGRPGEDVARAARENAQRFHADIEQQLGDRAFLCGDALSYADIAFYLAQLWGERWTAPMPQSAPRLLAWRERMTRRASVREAAATIVAYLVSQDQPIPPFLAELKAP
ncbi:MAG TPA: glutathione S-transferase family protein [Caulobacterales bacterium]|nr:glutathione S-transferase family protein [Caulobacterales bacterium]